MHTKNGINGPSTRFWMPCPASCRRVSSLASFETKKNAPYSMPPQPKPTSKYTFGPSFWGACRESSMTRAMNAPVHVIKPPQVSDTSQ